MRLGLQGRTAFISGATLGVGRGIAGALAREGVDLFITARDPDRLAATAAELTAQHRIRCEWAAADFVHPGEAERAARSALETMAGVDILVNNAGRSLPLSLDATTEDWQRGFQLNFLSHIEAIRALAPPMRRRGWGRIVDVMGTSFRAPGKVSAGTPAKYALWATSKALVDEFIVDGVTVNAVSIGKITSHQITEIYFSDPAAREELARGIPAGRLGRPEEVGDVVAFLASERAGYLTGSVVTVDGGLNRFIV